MRQLVCFYRKKLSDLHIAQMKNGVYLCRFTNSFLRIMTLEILIYQNLRKSLSYEDLVNDLPKGHINSFKTNSITNF
jgi:hypothetical protein